MTPILELLAAQVLKTTASYDPSARGDVLVSLNVAVMKQSTIATRRPTFDGRRFLRESPAGAPAIYSEVLYPYGLSQTSSNTSNSTSHATRNLIFEVVFPVAAFVLVCVVVAVLARRCYKSRTAEKQLSSRSNEDKMILESLRPGLPPRFTYAQMHEATRGFEKKLGAGGYGTVYEGMLRGGTRVAVKVFLDTASSSCKAGFCAEVMSLGSIRHENLVELRGFCVEEEHRMLVYELVANGSLDKALFGSRSGVESMDKSEVVLGWERRRAIAVDAARALAFLHGQAGVIHCDVKPENILLDEAWMAKMSDFGLAKLVAGGHVSIAVADVIKSGGGGARGTLGYAAPEWRKEGGAAAVTAASDVYSFGVVLLELVAGRRCLQQGKSFLPGAAFDLLAAQQDLAKLLDPRLQIPGHTDPEGVRAVVHVALWCIQEEVARRPEMCHVADMLAGRAEISPPPVCHFFAGSSHFFDDDAATTTTTSATTGSSSAFSGSWQISYLSGR